MSTGLGQLSVMKGAGPAAHGTTSTLATPLIELELLPLNQRVRWTLVMFSTVPVAPSASRNKLVASNPPPLDATQAPYRGLLSVPNGAPPREMRDSTRRFAGCF